jgi:hypothetical protein
MEVRLHIGTHKTGSSALQRFLYENHPVLARDTLLYPNAGRPEEGAAWGHHLLPWSLTRKGTPPGVWTALRRELRASPVPVAVLSSEAFTELINPRQFERLRSHLEPFDVSVIVYLRRQDEYVHGVYCTRVLFAGETRSFDEFAQRFRIDSYQRLLGRWKRSFGREAIIVRPYERDRLVGSDIVTDFFAELGLEIPTEAERSTESVLVNRSLPRNVVNGVLALRRAGVPAEEINGLTELLVEHAYRGRRTEADMASPAARRELLSRCEESNAAIAREYLGRQNGVLFRDLGVPDEAAWQRRYEGEHADLIASIRDAREAFGMRAKSALRPVT